MRTGEVDCGLDWRLTWIAEVDGLRTQKSNVTPARDSRVSNVGAGTQQSAFAKRAPVFCNKILYKILI